MIHWFLICFGCCSSSPKKVENISIQDRQQMSTQHPTSPKIMEQELTRTKSNKVVSNNLPDSVIVSIPLSNLEVVNLDFTVPHSLEKHSSLSHEDSALSYSNVESSCDTNLNNTTCSITLSRRNSDESNTLPDRNLPHSKSVVDIFRDSGLTTTQLIRGYSCCNCSPGEVIDINLDNRTCCRRYQNGIVVTESIETLDCCISVIDDDEE